jgi:hypothetical protein
MAQNYQPVSLDQLPVPQAPQPVQYKPAELSPPPDSPGSGNMGKAGQIADIGANFLQGWVQGKQKAAAKKLQDAQQSVNGAQYAFTIAQQNAAKVMSDPNSTPEQKQQAEAARQQAWKGYLDIAQQYTEPEKKSGSKKGGAKGAISDFAGGIGQHLKNAFGTEDPHIFSQATMALLRTTGPPAIPQDFEQQKAALDLSNDQKRAAANDALADAVKRGAPQDEIDRLADQASAISSGTVKSSQQKLTDSLADATQAFMSGKPVSDQTKSVLQAQGFIPKPIEPNIFLQADDKGMLYAVSVDPSTGKTTKSAQPIMKTRLPQNAREEAWDVYQGQLKQLGDLLKKAHPDWTDQQISQAKANAMLSGTFKIKEAPNMTPAQTQKASSEAIKNAIFGGLDDEERQQATGYGLVGAAGGTYMLTNDLSKASGIKGLMGTVTGGSYGMNQKQAADLDTKIRTGAREWLANQKQADGVTPKYTQDQIDALVAPSIGEAKSRFEVSSLDPPPNSGGKVASKSDIQAYADANGMTYDQAKKAVQDQGYTPDEK